MSPECATTSAAASPVVVAWASDLATSRQAAVARDITSAAGSNPSGRRWAARYPGHCSSISSGVSPCHGPASDSRSRGSSVTGATPRYGAITAAVCDARCRSLDHTAENRCPSRASMSPTRWAWRSPRSVRGGSARPCHRRCAFHSLWPCRTSRSANFDSGIPGEASGATTLVPVAIVRLFASARQAAGTGRDELPGDTVEQVLQGACERYGDAFAAVLGNCRVWVNGEDVPAATPIGPDDEVAILPPVSGGGLLCAATSGGLL
jgi:sulfur-carrier protein